MGFAHSLYQFGDFRLDPRGRALVGPGGRVAITAKAFDTLVFLVEHAGDLVERPALTRMLWPNTIVEDNNLNQAIVMLRRALGDGYIATIPGRGYQFVAKVAMISDPEESNAEAGVHADPETVQPTLPGPTAEELPRAIAEKALENGGSQAAPAPTAGSWSRITRRAGWATLIVGALAVGGVAWWRTATITVMPPAPATMTAAAARPRIAILPFVHSSPDESNAVLTDGLHEEVLAALFATSSSTLDVISSTTMRLYRNSSKPVTEIAAELDATYVLSASVQREGEAVRLSLQLIDARSDVVLMNEIYNKTLTSALTLQSEVAQQVVQRLSAHIAGLQPALARPAAAPTTDTQAWDLFLRAKIARQRLNGSSPIDSWRNVERFLDGAIARDARFAQAYVARSRLHFDLFRLGYDASDRRLELARADLATVQRLAPGEPATLAAEALLAEDPAQAIELFVAAELAGLTDPDLLLEKAGRLIRAHRVREGGALMKQLSASDPGNAFLSVALWFHFATIREPKLALQALADAEVWSPNGAWAPLRAYTLFSFTGNIEPLVQWSNPAIVQQAAATGGQDPGDALRNVTDRLVLLEQYRKARDVIDSVTFDEIRLTLFSYFVVPGTQMPTAEMRGWTNLLLDDAAEAANDGRRVLDFLERTPATPAAEWFRLALSADAHTFVGDRSAAIADAREMLKLTEAAQNPSLQVVGQMLAARVFAWAGDPDAGIALLERLAVDEPGLPPADVVRDPRYSVPLRDEPRFLKLAARLEAQMAATRLEIGL